MLGVQKSLIIIIIIITYVELHCLTVSSTNYMLLLQLFTDAL